MNYMNCLILLEFIRKVIYSFIYNYNYKIDYNLAKKIASDALDSTIGDKDLV